MSLQDLLTDFRNLDTYPRTRQKHILEKLLFELYLRKGQAPPQLIALHVLIDNAPLGIKFNPYHDEQAQEAIRTAKEAGNVETQMGKYGTPQIIYEGTNGITVIVETSGRNAGKIITLYRQ